MLFKHFTKKLQLIFIGGLAEIGKNFTLLRYGNNIIAIDCGLKFPEEDMFGIDIIIPDMSYIVKNKNIIRGLIVTHGHEDHIGGIPYLLKELNVPIYSTKLTCGLIESKLKEHKLSKPPKFHIVSPKNIVNIGPFKIEFIHMSHSIPDAVGLAVHTPVGTIIHTGDFKIDYTPIDGQKIDLLKFEELGKAGVLLMLSDSTNADIQGSTPSEAIISEPLNSFFSSAKGRIIVALFASNIHRVQQILDAAQKVERKIAISGLSMQNVINKAKELGYLNCDKNTFIKLNDIEKEHDGDLVILSTGSQGEPMSALTRMAKGEHKQVKIQKNDTVIISALPIPGNEKSVNRTIDCLFKLGAKVIYEERHGLHASGHACQDEMRLLLNLVKPKYFIPIHGEYRHLIAHAQIAQETGIKPENILIAENGDVINISKNKISKEQKIKINDSLIDGTGAIDNDSSIIFERQRLANGGIVIVTAFYSKSHFNPISDINIEAIGFAFAKEQKNLIKDTKNIVKEIMLRHQNPKMNQIPKIKQDIQKSLGKFFMKKMERKPVVVPIITYN